MVRNADGSVIIDTELDSSDVVIGAKEIEKRIASFASSVDRFGAKLQKATAGYASNAAEIMSREYSKGFEGAAAKLRDLANVKIPTDEYRKLNSEVEKVGTQLEKLLTRQEKLEELGVSKNTAQWKSLQYDIDQTGAKYDQLAAAKERMEADGSAYMLGVETEEYRKLSRELGTLQGGMSAGATRGQMFWSVLSLLGSTIKTVAGHALSLGKRFAQIGFNAVAAGAKKAANGLKAFISFARKAVSGLKSLKSQTRKTDLSTMGLVKSLTSLKRLLITRIKRMFISAIFNNVREGIQQLARYSSTFNKQMSDMKNSATQLSGNIAVLIGNVISVVEPVITRIIDLMAQGVDWLNQFIATLQGKSSYTSAAKGAESYADATDKATKAQKNLNRELYSFDELNRQSGNDGDNGSSDASAITYVDKPITLPGAVTDWIERLKGAWENADWKGIGRVIADGINAVFGKLDSLISWENIGDTITRIVTGIADILNSMVEGIDWQKIGRTFGSGINTIVNTLYLLLTSIDWYAIGKALATGLNGLVGRVDWKMLGRLFGARINALFDTIRGFAENFKWGDAGTAFGNAVNALKNEVNWYNLGDSLKKLLKGAVALMQYAVKTIEWGDAGTKFAEALNAFFKQDSLWADAGDTIDTTIKGLLDFTEKAVITFDEKQLADDIKALFRGVDWRGIATETWSLVKTTFKKFGSFLDVLFSDESNSHYDPWKKMYIPDPETSLGSRIGKKLADAINEGIKLLPAEDIGDALDTALNGVLDFAISLVKNFDPDTFREKLEEALGRVDWDAIARKAWLALKDSLVALAKATPLLGDLIQKWENEISAEDFAHAIKTSLGGAFEEIAAYGDVQGGLVGENFFDGFRKKVLDENGHIKEEFRGRMGEMFSESEIEAFERGDMTIVQFFNGLGFGGINAQGEATESLLSIIRGILGAPESEAQTTGENTIKTLFSSYIAETILRQNDVSNAVENAFKEIWGALDAEGNGEIIAFDYFNSFMGEVVDQKGIVKPQFKKMVESMFGSVDSLESGKIGAKDFMQGLVKGMAEADGDTRRDLISIIDGVLEAVKTDPDGLDEHSPSKRAQTYGMDFMEGFTGGMESQGPDADRRSKTLFDGLFDTIIKTADAMQQFQTIILNALSNLETHFPMRMETYKTLFENGWSNVNSVTSTGWTSIQSTVTTAMSNLTKFIPGQFRSIGSSIENENWWSVGDNIVAGIQNGVQDNWKWLQKTVRNLAISLYNTACQALGIHSPSKVFAEIGSFVDAGLQQGLEDGERNVLQTAANIADAVTKEMTPESPEVDVTADSVIGGMQAVINGLGGVADTFKVILDTIRSMGGLLTPQIAAGTVVPYKTKIDTTGSDNDDIIATLETLNGDLESVIIQAVNNAVIALVEAIQNNGGGNRTMDVKTLTSQVIDEINRRTRAQGTPPIIV